MFTGFPDTKWGDVSADDYIEGKPITEDDPLWDIVGMFDSGPDGPTDVSQNKHKYLAEAYSMKPE